MTRRRGLDLQGTIVEQALRLSDVLGSEFIMVAEGGKVLVERRGLQSLVGAIAKARACCS